MESSKECGLQQQNKHTNNNQKDAFDNRNRNNYIYIYPLDFSLPIFLAHLGRISPKKILINHLLDYLFDLFQRLRGAPLEPSWSEPAGIFEIKDGTKITQTKTIDLQKDLYTLIRFFQDSMANLHHFKVNQN